MGDVVVTVPQSFGLQTWVEEGDAAGTEWSGEYWDFTTWGSKPDIEPGERVYVVYKGKLRGFAPLVELQYREVRNHQGHLNFVRAGDAEAVTISEYIRGFRGWRYRWWKRKDERPFPEWKSQ